MAICSDKLVISYLKDVGSPNNLHEGYLEANIHEKAFSCLSNKHIFFFMENRNGTFSYSNSCFNCLRNEKLTRIIDPFTLVIATDNRSWFYI